MSSEADEDALAHGIEWDFPRQFKQLTLETFECDGEHYTRASWRAMVHRDARAGKIKTTNGLLDALKGWHAGKSDYWVAAELGVTKSTVSKWRTGKAGLSDETAVKIAMHLDLEPHYVMLIAQRERACAFGVQEALDKLLKQTRKAGVVIKRAAVAALATAAVLSGSGLQPAPAAEVRLTQQPIHYAAFAGLRSGEAQVGKPPQVSTKATPDSTTAKTVRQFSCAGRCLSTSGAPCRVTRLSICSDWRATTVEPLYRRFE